MLDKIKQCQKTAKLITLLILLALIACDSDHGLEPIRSNIQGTITYVGDWPAPATEVRLVTATKFPPSGVSDLIIGESIPLTGDSYDYNFYLKIDCWCIQVLRYITISMHKNIDVYLFMFQFFLRPFNNTKPP